MRRLHALLRGRVRSVADAAVRAGGKVPEDDLVALERLSRLAALEDGVRARARWPAAAIVIATLLLSSALLLVRLHEMEIELDLTASEVGFVVPTEQVLADPIRVVALEASGLRRVELPPDAAGAPRVYEARPGGDAAVRLSIDPADRRPGTIDVSELRVPANTHVTLRASDHPRQLRVSLTPPTEITATVLGAVTIRTDGAAPEHHDLATPQAIVLVPGGRQGVLDLTLPDGRSVAFSPRLAVADLTFTRIDTFPGATSTVLREASTVLAGSLYLDALAGREYKLRPHEALRFAHASGELHTLIARDDGIALEFQGIVENANTGSSQNPVRLMPTRLEALTVNRQATLLWGATAFVSGILFSLARWWRAL